MRLKFLALSILLLSIQADANGQGNSLSYGSGVRGASQYHIPSIQTSFSDSQDESKDDSEKKSAEDLDEDDDMSAYLSIFEGLGPGEVNEDAEPATRRLPVVVEEIVKPGKEASDDQFKKLKFYADYDKGFAILPYNKKKTPFDLRINGWIQFRHHGFARNVTDWTDNAGVTRPVRNRNAFDIERARLSFKGAALDERLTYFYQLDGDTDGRHGVDFFDYWWSWKFSDRFRVQFGKRKVTAGRQWLLGARRTRFIDRPIANDFFRPDRTIGVFGIGKIGETGHYEAMIGNGYRTSNLPNSTTDDQFTFAFNQYFDPNGDYGGQLVDFDNNLNPLIRFGHSFVYSPITSDALGNPQAETDFLRLSDGTRLNQTGALSPGVTVSGANVLFYGVDAAAKWRGWSINSEVFMRWLNDFEADGPLPVDSLMQRGFYVEGGRFLIPQKLDVNLRYSEINGLVGGGTEYAAGLNWYPLQNSYKFKWSFDVTVLDGSPLNNSASDILVGDDGTLFRTQIQAEF
ncbi:MAG: porin [Mariniblastus sp.]